MILSPRTVLALVPNLPKGLLFLFVAMAILSSLAEAVGVAAVFPLIQLVAEPGSVHSSWWMSALYQGLNFTDDRMFVIVFAAGVCLFFALRALTLVMVTWLQTRLATNAEIQVTGDLVLGYMRSRYDILFERNTSVFLNNILDPIQHVFNALLIGITSVLTESLSLSIILCVLLLADPIVTVAAIILFAATISLYSVCLRNRVQQWGADLIVARQRKLTLLRETLSLFKDIHIGSRQGYFVARIIAVQTQVAGLLIRNAVASILPRLIVENAALVMIIGVLGFMLLSDRSGKDALPLLGMFGATAFRLMPVMSRLVAALHNIRTGIPALEALLGDQALINRYGGFEKPKAESVLTFHDKIEFHNVVYRYAGKSGAGLAVPALTIRRGEAVGVVGASGAGKSTLVDLLMGFIVPESGAILVDGVPVHGVGSWGTVLGYVPQDIRILDDTLEANIAFGVPAAEIDHQRVLEAVRQASLDGVVAAREEGINSPVGEGGIRLSAGQRQRIGIARALYHRSELLVLDEATSALDSSTEKELSEAVMALKGVKTIIVIAHRLSSVRHCDRLLMLSEGRIIDSGNFEELRDRCDDFRAQVEHGTL